MSIQIHLSPSIVPPGSVKVFLIHCCYFSPKALGNIFRNLWCKEILASHMASCPEWCRNSHGWIKSSERRHNSTQILKDLVTCTSSAVSLSLWGCWKGHCLFGPLAFSLCFFLKHSHHWVLLQWLPISLPNPILLLASDLIASGLWFYPEPPHLLRAP